MPSIAVFGLKISDTVQTFDLYDIQEMSKHLDEQNMSWSHVCDAAQPKSKSTFKVERNVKV